MTPLDFELNVTYPKLYGHVYSSSFWAILLTLKEHPKKLSLATP